LLEIVVYSNYNFVGYGFLSISAAGGYDMPLRKWTAAG